MVAENPRAPFRTQMLSGTKNYMIENGFREHPYDSELLVLNSDDGINMYASKIGKTYEITHAQSQGNTYSAKDLRKIIASTDTHSLDDLLDRISEATPDAEEDYPLDYAGVY